MTNYSRFSHRGAVAGDEELVVEVVSDAVVVVVLKENK